MSVFITVLEAVEFKARVGLARSVLFNLELFVVVVLLFVLDLLEFGTFCSDLVSLEARRDTEAGDNA